MVTSVSLGGIIVRTLAQNARDVGSIPALGVILWILIIIVSLLMIAITYIQGMS